MKHLKKTYQAGLTLIEMVVALGIFFIITGVVMYNHGKFNSSIMITNLAHEVALAVRQAQVYGLAVKQSTTDPDPVEYAYGASFEEGVNVLYIFADKNGNRQFDFDAADTCVGAPGMECVERIEIRSDIKVDRLLADGDEVSALTILYLRPNPVALIYMTGNETLHNRGSVVLYSEKADKRKQIVVEYSGQISVQDMD